jgi:hypothetical protein
MSNNEPIPLLFGEIYVDYTLTRHGEENKLRLGGIAHAARGFWALAKPFSVAAVLPTYLEELARRYLKCLGCVHFHVIGRVSGAPNVMAIHDPTEVADQAYEDLLREEKQIEHFALDLSGEGYRDVLIFPGG